MNYNIFLSIPEQLKQNLFNIFKKRFVTLYTVLLIAILCDKIFEE